MYYSYKRYKKKRKNHGRKLVVIFLILIIIFSFFYYKKRVSSTIFEYAEKKVHSIVNISVNSAILIGLNNNIKYDDLIIIEKDMNGDISLIATDSYKINQINREISLSTQTLIETQVKKGIYVPFGTLSGISIFSGYGKSFKLDILSADSVVCKFNSIFESVGINQTRHALYINVFSIVNIILPLETKRVEIVTEFLVSEAVIVGKIPEVYLNGSLFH